MYTRKANATRETPRSGQDDQPDAREGQAGRPGESERFMVPRKLGNAGGGTGPQFKTNAIRSEGPGDWVTYQLRMVFRNCRRRCTRKRRQKPAIASTPCTTRSAARTSWLTPMPNAAPTRAHRAWMVKTSQTSKRMGCNDGLANWRLRSGKKLIDRILSEECLYRRPTANSGRWASRCGLHNAPCSIRVEGSYGNAGRVGNPIPQSAICRVGDCDDVWQARLPLLRCYETAVDPVIDDPHTDAVSLANLFDVECTGGKRRARNAILVSDPSDHADREVFASRACEAIAVQHCDDPSVIERGCQGTDVSNERIGITKLFGAVRRQAQLDRFDGAALPANIQSQQLWLLALGDGDIPDQQAEHPLAVTRCGRWSGPKSRKV